MEALLAMQGGSPSALTHTWTFGFNRDSVGSVHNLSDSRQKVIFYASAHTGVLFDWVSGRQKLLLGHCNTITSTCFSRERRWLSTTDKGPNSMIIVWDMKPGLGRPSDTLAGSAATGSVAYENDGTLNAMPIKNIYNPHDGYGAVAVRFTPDNKYLVTLGDEPGQQTVCLWNWTTADNEPMIRFAIQGEPQSCLRVNPADPFEFMTNGPKSVNFFVWDKETNTVQQQIPMLSAKDFKHVPSGYTFSTFIPSLGQAASATLDGDVVVWTDRSLNNLKVKLERGQKAAIKFVKLHNSAINFITAVADKFIITGGAEGHVKVFDLNFRILFWYERLYAGPISSVAFSTQGDVMFDDVPIPELVVATKHSRVLLLHRQSASSSISAFRPGTAGGGADNASTAMTNAPSPVNPQIPGTLRSEKDGMELAGMPGVTNLLYGQYQQIRGLVTHPDQPRFAVGGDAGLLQVWDYTAKTLVMSRHFEETPVTTVGGVALPTTNGGSTRSAGGDASAAGNDAAKTGNNDAAHQTGGGDAASAINSSDANLGGGQTESKKKGPDPVSLKITSLAYSLSGKTLAVGFAHGVIKMLDAQTLEDLPQSYMIRTDIHGHQISHQPITKIAFSNDGDYCAAADANHVVCILRKEAVNVKLASAGAVSENRSSLGSAGSGPRNIKLPGDPDGSVKAVRHRIEWVFIGRRKTHYKDIIALMFPPKTAKETGTRLLSLSRDRHVAEYDLEQSSLLGGITVNSIRRIEQTFHPEAAVLYHKHHPVHPEQFLLTFNSGYKLKQFTASTQLCRKTVLGPTFGGHINNLSLIPAPVESKYLAFSTNNQVIGVAKLPLDGNPYKTMGIIGHPGQVSNLACSYNGAYILTAGGPDGVVNLWTINVSALEAQTALGGEGLDPYLNMLDPSGLGEESPVYREFEDYFFYAQLRSQGEDATQDRIISDQVSLAQVPSIMQAMGFYPSNQETDDMINEVKYSRFAQGEGEEVDSITLSELIKLYLNHRPVRDVSMEDIEVALSHAKRLEPGKPLPKGSVTKLVPKQYVSAEGVIALMQQYGESFSHEDAQEAFKELLMEEPPFFGRLPRKFTSKEFIHGVLGLSAVNPEDDVNAGASGATAAAAVARSAEDGRAF
ncbi:WD40-repeat-containing domain protein [Entophlyctis helioformis]|nr:WD40-repeat-containing domain protein [Entophlyctis helioformis]